MEKKAVDNKTNYEFITAGREVNKLLYEIQFKIDVFLSCFCINSNLICLNLLKIDLSTRFVTGAKVMAISLHEIMRSVYLTS